MVADGTGIGWDSRLCSVLCSAPALAGMDCMLPDHLMAAAAAAAAVVAAASASATVAAAAVLGKEHLFQMARRKT